MDILSSKYAPRLRSDDNTFTKPSGRTNTDLSMRCNQHCEVTTWTPTWMDSTWVDCIHPFADRLDACYHFGFCIIDLKPIDSTHYVTKYADDVSLLVPEKCHIDIMLEFSKCVLKWATNNKLTIQMAKTKELVFHRPNVRYYLPPIALPGIERVIYAAWSLVASRPWHERAC